MASIPSVLEYGFHEPQGLTSDQVKELTEAICYYQTICQVAY